MSSLIADARTRYVRSVEQVKRPVADGIVRSLQQLDELAARIPYPRAIVATPLRTYESAAERTYDVAEKLIAAQRSLVLNSVGAVTSYVERPRATRKPAAKPKPAAKKTPAK